MSRSNRLRPDGRLSARCPGRLDGRGQREELPENNREVASLEVNSRFSRAFS
jgi:hypothetical protein